MFNLEIDVCIDLPDINAIIKQFVDMGKALVTAIETMAKAVKAKVLATIAAMKEALKEFAAFIASLFGGGDFAWPRISIQFKCPGKISMGSAPTIPAPTS